MHPDMRAMKVLRLLFLAVLLALPTATLARDRDILVKAVKTGKVMAIDVDMTINASVEEVWGVMTDWDNMEKFIPGITTSEIVKREGNSYRVRQAGKIPLGLFSIKYDAVRDIEVVQLHESMRFQGVSGDFERLEGSVTIVKEGDATRVVYRVESVPTVWVPPFVGTAIMEHTTRSQFGEMRVEMLRRASAKAAAKAAPAPAVAKQAP